MDRMYWIEDINGIAFVDSITHDLIHIKEYIDNMFEDDEQDIVIRSKAFPCGMSKYFYDTPAVVYPNGTTCYCHSSKTTAHVLQEISQEYGGDTEITVIPALGDPMTMPAKTWSTLSYYVC